MTIFFTVLFSAFAVADVSWWRWADARLRVMRRARVGRAMLGAYIGLMLVYVVAFALLPRQMRLPHAWVPTWLLAMVYIWHLVVLPTTMVLFVPGKLVEAIVKIVRAIRARPQASEQRESPSRTREDEEAASISRRHFLAASAVAAPPLLTIGATAYSLPRLHEFRIRSIDVPISHLPREFEGLTIAHVSDTHIGKFTTPAMLRAVVDRTNAMRADLVVFTGDLIDLSLGALDDGIAMLRNLDSRSGFFICEGNHDLIQDRDEFETRMRRSALPILIDESRTIEVRGRKVQFLGQRWDRGSTGIAEATQRMLGDVEADAFPILLAHHPHAWTGVRDTGRIPLTLSGHTHGGQLMLNERLGAGAVMFKYWSGLYRHNGNALVVSNGVGNWFPLRINAPAEIIHLTLRQA